MASSSSGRPVDAPAAVPVAAGTRWTRGEDEQLVVEVRAGWTEEAIASRHGRTAGAIRARVERMVPADEGVPGERALEWLRTRLATADYDWRGTLSANRGRRAAPREAHARDRERGRQPTGLSDADRRRIESVGRMIAEGADVSVLPGPAVATLARYSNTELLRAGRRTWREHGRLTLDSWALECLQPGLSTLAAVTPHDLLDGVPDAALTIRELVAAAITEIGKTRDRQVLTDRLGLDDAEPKTLAAIARQMGLSRERIRQLQERAVRTAAARTGTGIC